MNWEAIGAVGEVVGAVGVIVTVGFLAFQIRQNSTLLKNNTRQLEQNHKAVLAEVQSRSSGASDPMLVVSQSTELSRIFHKGLANYRELDRESAMRFSMAMGPLLTGTSNSIMERRQLGIENVDASAYELDFAMRFLDTIGGRQWWAQGKGMFPQPFIEIIEEELAKRDTGDT